MMGENQIQNRTKSFCPVYDIECPSGPQAEQACENRFLSDYNPLTRFRDAEIEHCAIYRMEQEEARQTGTSPDPKNKPNSDETKE